MSDTERKVSVEIKSSSRVGGCCSCADYACEHGEIPHDVTVIYVGNFALRLCFKCREKLVELLIRQKLI